MTHGGQILGFSDGNLTARIRWIATGRMKGLCRVDEHG